MAFLRWDTGLSIVGFPVFFGLYYVVTTTRTTFPGFIMAGAHPLRDVITHGYDAGRTGTPALGMAYGP